jgi:small subunit ribosomal protein S11
MNNVVQKKGDLSLKRSNLLRKRKSVPAIARAVIFTTFNNNIISISDSEGNVIISSSSGAHGFKGTRKATPYAAQVTATEVAKIAVELGVKCVSVMIRGIGPGRDSAVLALRNAGLKISVLTFDMRLPHNGCRPRKRRRI